MFTNILKSKTPLLFFFIALSIVLNGCLKEEKDDNNEDGAETQYLNGTTDAPLTLENIYEDPQKIDYYVDGSWTIDAAVTVEPGVRIVMMAGMRISVNANGSFNANGDLANKIYIVGEQDVSGYWEYLRFYNSNNPNNRLNHTVIQNGGGNSTRDAVVYVEGNSRLSVENTTVQSSAGYGLYVNHKDGVLPDFGNNIFTGCEKHPIGLASLSQTSYMDNNTQFTTDNTYNSIYVKGATSSTPYTVVNVSGPYLLNGNTTIDSDVEIEAGTDILFGPATRITVNSGGSLKAIGNSSERITIKGDQEVEGYWEYIRFYNSNNTNNNFQYVDVSHGGGNSTRDANIYLEGSSRFQMGNSSVNYSKGNGIEIASNATFVDDGNNSYTGNLLDDVLQN